MGLREQLAKAAGLFIEVSPKEEPQSTGDVIAQLSADPPPLDSLDAAPVQAKTVEHIVREAPGPDLHEISVPPADVPAPTSTSGSLDFATLYQQAGLPAVPYTAEQMLEMLATLPRELSLDAKRASVKVMLNSVGKSIGATPESIVTDASRKLAALAAYSDHITKQSTDLAAQYEAEITSLQAQIAEKRQAIAAAHQQQATVTAACHTEAERLDDVLEFFSLDIPPSKYAAPEQINKG